MAAYSLQIIPLSALDFYGATPSKWQIQNPTGTGFDWRTYHFEYSASDLVTVSVSDTDNILQDDPDNPWWSGGHFPPHSQVIGSDVTVDGRTYDSGQRIEDEYELNVRDQQGNVFRMVAVSVDSDPGNPYSGSVVIGYTFDGEWPPEDARLTIIRGSGQDGQQMLAPVCFAAGTLIATPRGELPVERLQRGDLVLTLDHGPKPLLLITTREMAAGDLARAPKMRPIRIAAGALGPDLPRRDLVVSPQHRLLVASRIAHRMFGAPEVLVAARHLVGAPGIETAGDLDRVTYIHLLCDDHQIVTANGVPSESLYTGPQALRSLSRASRRQVLALFPDLTAASAEPPVPARTLVDPKRARRLLARHRKNERAFLELACRRTRPQAWPQPRAVEPPRFTSV